MTRVSRLKREKMTHDMLEHLHGKSHYPATQHAKYVDKTVAGAGLVGAKFEHNTPTEHHGRRTIPQPQRTNPVRVYGPPGSGHLYFDDETRRCMHDMAVKAAEIKRRGIEEKAELT